MTQLKPVAGIHVLSEQSASLYAMASLKILFSASCSVHCTACQCFHAKNFLLPKKKLTNQYQI